jgi:hypothetical protein
VALAFTLRKYSLKANEDYTVLEFVGGSLSGLEMGACSLEEAADNKIIMADAAAAAAAAASSSSSPSLDFLSVLFHTHFLVSQTCHWVSF